MAFLPGIPLANAKPYFNIPTVRKGFAVAVISLLVGVGLWLVIRGSHSLGNGITTGKSIEPLASGTGGDSEATGSFKTKTSNRELAGPRATHAPERLKEFMLPEVAIDGLTLGEALRKLMGVYEEACKKTGEIPLRLTFDLPPGSAKKLHLKLSPRNFNSSVQLLATFAGMKVSRNKLQYHFEPFADERKQVNKAIAVPPDFASVIPNNAGLDPDADPFAESESHRMPIGELIKTSGLTLDPSTQLSLTATGTLNINTTSSADLAMISALVGVSEMPAQQKFATKVVEIPSGVDWTPPDVSQMTEDQVQLLMRELTQKAGVELMTMPSMTARSGQNGTIEIVRELITPVGESGQEFETHNLGHVMQIRGDALGFGHEVALNYTDTTGDVDASTGKANINKRTDMTDSGFASDGGARLVVQTRADGSRTLLLVTSTLIDATGRPMSDRE